MVFLRRNSALRLIQNRADEGAGGTRILPPWNLKAIEAGLISCKPPLGYHAKKNPYILETPNLSLKVGWLRGLCHSAQGDAQVRSLQRWGWFCARS